jgi:hypothetical protein
MWSAASARTSGAKFQPRHQPGARADEEQGNLLTVATGSWLRVFWEDQEVVDPQARWLIYFMENPFFNNMDDFPGVSSPMMSAWWLIPRLVSGLVQPSYDWNK